MVNRLGRPKFANGRLIPTGMKVWTCTRSLNELSYSASTLPCAYIMHSRATEDGILAVQVFDQKKFKKKDQGFLGVINIRIGDVIELAEGAEGTEPMNYGCRFTLLSPGVNNYTYLRSNAYARP